MNGDKTIREQLCSVQVSFDKEAAWNRLHARLDHKKDAKRSYRLAWVAAAVLLIAISAWNLTSTDKARHVVVTKQPATSIPADNEQTIITNIPIATNPQPEPLEQKTKTRISNNGAQLNLTQAIEPQAEEIVVEVVQEEPIQTEEQPVAAAKPKMKVMHINEVIEEERIERRVLNSRYADNKNRHSYPYQETNSYELRNPFKIYISTQN